MNGTFPTKLPLDRGQMWHVLMLSSRFMAVSLRELSIVGTWLSLDAKYHSRSNGLLLTLLVNLKLITSP